MSKQAMTMALDALQSCTYDDEGYCLIPDNEDAITAMRAALDAPTVKESLKVPYLCNGARFKIAFFDDGDDEEYGGDIHVKCFNNFMSELDGRWVALVPAENDCHLKRNEYVPLSDARIISLAYDCNAMPESCTDESLKLFAHAIKQEVRGK